MNEIATTDNKPVATQLPMPMPQRQDQNTASEKVEMQRAAAQVYGALQMALHRPRNEDVARSRILELCNNVHFAVDAVYAVPRGGGKAEGLSVKAAREFARIWGNVDYGVVDHGTYERQTQLEAYSIDLESNVRTSVRFTVQHERWVNGGIKKVENPQEISELTKARSSKEVRNVVLATLPFYINEEAIKECKRTIHRSVQDVRSAWELAVKKFAESGVTEGMLLRYVNAKDPTAVDASSIVELRMLMQSINADAGELDLAFPERKKQGTPGSKPSATTSAGTQAPRKESGPPTQSNGASVTSSEETTPTQAETSDQKSRESSEKTINEVSDASSASEPATTKPATTKPARSKAQPHTEPQTHSASTTSQQESVSASSVAEIAKPAGIGSTVNSAPSIDLF